MVRSSRRYVQNPCVVIPEVISIEVHDNHHESLRLENEYVEKHQISSKFQCYVSNFLIVILIFITGSLLVMTIYKIKILRRDESVHIQGQSVVGSENFIQPPSATPQGHASFSTSTNTSSAQHLVQRSTTQSPLHLNTLSDRSHAPMTTPVYSFYTSLTLSPVLLERDEDESKKLRQIFSKPHQPVTLSGAVEGRYMSVSPSSPIIQSITPTTVSSDQWIISTHLSENIDHHDFSILTSSQVPTQSASANNVTSSPAMLDLIPTVSPLVVAVSQPMKSNLNTRNPLSGSSLTSSSAMGMNTSSNVSYTDRANHHDVEKIPETHSVLSPDFVFTFRTDENFGKNATNEEVPRSHICLVHQVETTLYDYSQKNNVKLNIGPTYECEPIITPSYSSVPSLGSTNETLINSDRFGGINQHVFEPQEHIATSTKKGSRTSLTRKKTIIQSSFPLPYDLITSYDLRKNRNALRDRQWYIEFSPHWQEASFENVQDNTNDKYFSRQRISARPIPSSNRRQGSKNITKSTSLPSTGILSEEKEQQLRTVLPEIVQQYRLEYDREKSFAQYNHNHMNTSEEAQSDVKIGSTTKRGIKQVQNKQLKGKRLNNLFRDDERSGTSTNRSPSVKRKVILIRVHASDVEVNISEQNLYQIVLGYNSETNNMVTSLKQQYFDCSQGLVQLIPYENINIPSSGVITVTVSNNANTYTFNTIFSEANALVLQTLGINGIGASLGDFVDHAIYIIPNDVQPPQGSPEGVGQVSLSGTDSYMSVVSDQWINDESIINGSESLVVLLQSTGRNLGLGNAWENGDMYGDITGAMGRPTFGVSLVCFNGIMFDHLRWMRDRTIRFDPFLCPDRRIDLVPFTNYDISIEGQAAIILLGEYSLTYNKKQLYNIDTPAYPDSVLVHRRLPFFREAVHTSLISVLNITNTVFSYNDGGVDIVIEVCSFNEGVPEIELADSVTLAFGIGTLPCETAVYQEGTECNISPTATSSPTTALEPLTSPPTYVPMPTYPPASSHPVSQPIIVTPTISTASPTIGRDVPLYTPVWITPKYDRYPTNPDFDFWNCEDFLNVRFYFDDSIGFQRCTWLRENINQPYKGLTIKEIFCVNDHLANYFCEQTCQTCTSNCQDKSSSVVQYMGSNYDCKWLSTKSFLLLVLCDEDVVKMECPETCKVCKKTI